MNNSLLLRAAMALCSVNVLFAVLSTWSMSSARSRLNEGLQQTERAVADITAKLTAETAARKDTLGASDQRLQAAEKEIDALRAKVFPPAPAPRRPTSPSEEPGAASEDSATPPVKLKQ